MSRERRDLGDGSGRTALVDGAVVGGYRCSYLASGGMSVVYRGEAPGGRTAVLKEVAAANTREVPSLISEKTLLERLDHPGIVGYLGFFSEEGYYYLVTELVPGEPLSSLLRPEAPPPIDEVVDWGVQLCEIFSYLHAQRPPIVYRDLKSENILLAQGKITLIDFGIARLHKGDRLKDTELMGSPVTASPEHYGGAETDARSDIYTLGATLYELLTGGRRKTVGAFQFASLRGLRPEVPEALDSAILRALDFQPEKRFQSAEAFRDALLQAVGRPLPERASAPLPTEPEVHSESAPVPRTAPGSRASRRGLAVGLLLLGLSVAGGWGLLWGRRGPSEGAMPSHQASLEGPLFGAGEVDGRPVVFMGEDIGLFCATPWKAESGADRARVLAARLNTFYKSPCPSCGGSALEPNDIKVGRYSETGDVVVFYAHMHGYDHLHWGPELLVTVDSAQAKALQTTPRYLASYWRDLFRDTVALSRGFSVENSALGEELAQAFRQAREQLEDDSTVENLRAILQQTTATQALALQSLFARVPDRRPAKDDFGGIEGYEPLRD